MARRLLMARRRWRTEFRLVFAAFRSGVIKPRKRVVDDDGTAVLRHWPGAVGRISMHGFVGRWLAMLALAGICFAAAPATAQSEKRIALVIGNAAYPQGALATAANDAGLIAQTLQAAGFDVVGARDLDGDTLRKSFRDFIQKAQASGPGTVAMIYLAGYGVQLAGENYFIPVDSNITRDTDIPTEALR